MVAPTTLAAAKADADVAQTAVLVLDAFLTAMLDAVAVRAVRVDAATLDRLAGVCARITLGLAAVQSLTTGGANLRWGLDACGACTKEREYETHGKLHKAEPLQLLARVN